MLRKQSVRISELLKGRSCTVFLGERAAALFKEELANMHKSVEEFSVKTLEIGGLGAALQALRLPFGKDVRSEIRQHIILTWLEQKAQYNYGIEVTPDENDVKLINTLVKRGDEHAKILRGVVVWCEINAPRYWWQEMATYRVGCECLSSESTMHCECKGLSEDELVEAKEHIEEGHMQKRILMLSYQTLRRIYFQRRSHRLPQWRIFCDWIKTLPFAEEFITIENGNDNQD